MAKGLMGSSPPSVIEVWRCCSLHTYFHTHFLLGHERSKQTQQIPECSVLLFQSRKSPKHGNLWMSPSYARPRLQNLLITHTSHAHSHPVSSTQHRQLISCVTCQSHSMACMCLILVCGLCCIFFTYINTLVTIITRSVKKIQCLSP